MLSTFEEKGYVFHNSDTKRYELGLKLMELSKVVEERFQLGEVIQPIMNKLALETGESVLFTALENEQAIFLRFAEGEKLIRYKESVGRRSPLYTGASNKVILANLSPIEQNLIIDKGIEAGAIALKEKEELLLTLKEIEKNGWAYTSGETFDDVAAVSLPLFEHSKKVFGSISIACPGYRFAYEDAKSILPLLSACQQEMNAIFKSLSFPARNTL